MSEKVKTIKQIADEIGVSKTAVNKKIDNLGLRSSLQKNANQFTIDKNQEKLIKSAFIQNQSQTENINRVYENDNQSKTSLQLISMLQKELDIKNKQIEDQQQTIQELTATIKAQAQSINADNQTALAEKIIQGQQLLDPPKKSFISRLFGK